MKTGILLINVSRYTNRATDILIRNLCFTFLSNYLYFQVFATCE